MDEATTKEINQSGQSYYQELLRAADTLGGAMMLGPLGAIAGYNGVIGDVRNAVASAALAPGRIVQSQLDDAYSGRYNPNDEGQLVSRGIPDALELAGYATTGGLAAGPAADAATLGTVTRVGPRASIRTGADFNGVLEGGNDNQMSRAARQALRESLLQGKKSFEDSLGTPSAKISMEDIEDRLPPPKSFMDRIWDNYAKRMTPEEFLQSEPLWSGAHQMSQETGMPEYEAFAYIANQIFQRMEANRYMTPQAAKRFMHQARTGLHVVQP